MGTAIGQKAGIGSGTVTIPSADFCCYRVSLPGWLFPLKLFYWNFRLSTYGQPARPAS